MRRFGNEPALLLQGNDLETFRALIAPSQHEPVPLRKRRNEEKDRNQLQVLHIMCRSRISRGNHLDLLPLQGNEPKTGSSIHE